jgi:hypothetical protein
VSRDGKCLTQRTHPRLALIEPTLSATGLRLSTPGFGSLDVQLESKDAPLRSVDVWSHHGLQADDCGDEAHSWLSAVLGEPFWLVRIGASFRRPIHPAEPATSDLFTFADSYPFLAVSEASLADLNDRLLKRGEPALPMNRFRPNLVIEGTGPYDEDTWNRLRIGAVTFRASGPCARCIVTTTDQLTTVRGKEPLRTLATYRADAAEPRRINFGQNLTHEDKSGVVCIGDEVVLV